VLRIAQGEAEAVLGKLATSPSSSSSRGAERARPSPSSPAAAGHEIGQAAVTMLASLINETLSFVVRAIVVANKTAEAATKSKQIEVVSTATSMLDSSLRVFLTLVETLEGSCQTILGAALDVLERHEEGQEEDGDAGQRAVQRERALSRASSVSFSPSRGRRARAASTASLSSAGGDGGGKSQQQLLWQEVDAALQASPVGALLPLVVLAVMEVARYQPSTLLPILEDLVLTLSTLELRVRRLVAYLPPGATLAGSTRVAAVGGRTTRQQVFESSHPYLPNTDQVIVVHFPKATHIVVEFDPQTRTETTYDFVREH